ncbi:hypothetical protein SK128_016043 [Halocaridina rubra]|uniref:Cell division cycle protein 123 homolog n=1 Tax=Halocaridina rubra TaxID=373956 RepID=A0AAN8WMY8_HALRR
MKKMKVHEMFTCALPNWYEKFKKHTIESIFLPIPPDVLAYLQDNGTLVLPEGSLPETQNNPSSKENDEDNEWDNNETPEDAAQVKGPNFEAFNNKIKDAIAQVGGSVFPKLNWSAPKDAKWIALNNSLRCSTPGDIYLLTKSSTFSMHDLTQPYKDCHDQDEVDTSVDYVLVLRKWMEINPAYEFRCFVRDKELIGISQRDVSQSYPCIGPEKPNIISDIQSFWHETIENKFPLESYTFDIYRPAKDSIILIDFNVFGPTTDCLLFDWVEFKVLEDIPPPPIPEPRDDSLYEEIDAYERSRRNMSDNRRCPSPVFSSENPDFRYISRVTGIQPSPYMSFGLPQDFVDLSTGRDPQKLIDYLTWRTNISDDLYDSSDEEQHC